MFADWFPNGDGLLAIHREDMLGPTKEPILLRLLPTDSGHYLLPVDGREHDDVPQGLQEKGFLPHSQDLQPELGTMAS